MLARTHLFYSTSRSVPFSSVLLAHPFGLLPFTSPVRDSVHSFYDPLFSIMMFISSFVLLSASLLGSTLAQSETVSSENAAKTHSFSVGAVS